MQGSLWSSQRGGGFFEKSFVHDSIDACGSMKGSEKENASLVVGDLSGIEDFEPGECDVVSWLLSDFGGVVFAAKNPFKDCWRLVIVCKLDD